ncbi:MAG TPA: TRAM domain-containing protein [Actinomycetaceae bacterium]|nr:TRAM domain-containing protein [Actinomycetaceae bacterium]
MTGRLILEAGDPAHGGFCVARVPDDDASGLGGKVALVTGALPGERVEVEIAEDHPRHLIARTVEVIEASPSRVPHVWPLAERTGVGGADLGHVAPDAQLRWKEAVIADTLRRIGGHAVVEAAAAVTPDGRVRVQRVEGGTVRWRTRVGFVVDDEGRPAMRRGRSHETVALDSMPLAVEEMNGLELFGGSWQLRPGTEVAAVAPSASPPLVVTTGGVWRAPGRKVGAEVMERVPTEYGPLRYRLHAGGFWQSHRAAPEVLVKAVLEAARPKPGDHVLELYSGAGLFTLPLAHAVGARGAVLGLEGARRAVADATKNLSGLPQARVEVARVDGRRISAERARIDVVVLDPPRTGAGGAVTAALKARRPERIVYVACDPAALARDLETLVAEYDILRLDAYDLFPSTHHVEMVAALVRR